MSSRRAQRRALAQFESQFPGGAPPYGYGSFAQQYGMPIQYAQHGYSTTAIPQYNYGQTMPAIPGSMAAMNSLPMASRVGSTANAPLSGPFVPTNQPAMPANSQVMPLIPAQTWAGQQQQQSQMGYGYVSNQTINNTREKMQNTMWRYQQWATQNPALAFELNNPGASTKRRSRAERKALDQGRKLQHELRDEDRKLGREQAKEAKRGSKRRARVGTMYAGNVPTNRWMYGAY